jgi:tetratricopeptide (TPR) repeat protein
MKADLLYKETLDIMKLALSEDDPLIVATKKNLAMNMRAQGKFAEAAVIQKECLEKQKTLLGPDNPRTIGTMMVLANNYCDQELFEKAERLYELCLEKRRSVLGIHPATLDTMSALAKTYLIRGKVAKANELMVEYSDMMNSMKEIGQNDLAELTTRLNKSSL